MVRCEPTTIVIRAQDGNIRPRTPYLQSGGLSIFTWKYIQLSQGESVFRGRALAVAEAVIPTKPDQTIRGSGNNTQPEWKLSGKVFR